MIDRLKTIGRKREILLGAVAVFLLLLVLGRQNTGFSFLTDWKQVREQIELQQDLYSRYYHIYSQKEDVKRVYESNLETIEKVEKKVFTGHDIHVAAAKLQKVVQELASDNDIKVQRLNTQKPVQISGDLYAITLGLYGQAFTMADFNRFLETLEYHEDKYLYTPRLYVKEVRDHLTLEVEILSVAMIRQRNKSEETKSKGET